jgi:hypothetical protein
MQLLDYPAGKVDGPDCLAGADKDQPDVTADEYRPLEEVLEGDWRYCH